MTSLPIALLQHRKRRQYQFMHLQRSLNSQTCEEKRKKLHEWKVNYNWQMELNCGAKKGNIA